MKTKQLQECWKEEDKAVEFLLNKSERVFKRNLSNIDKIDSKFIQLLVFVTAVFLFSVRFIQTPNTSFLFGIYLFSILSFSSSIVLIFFGFRVRKYRAVDTNKLVKEFISREDQSEIKLKKDVIGILSYRVEDIKRTNSKKQKYFDWSAILIGFGIIMILILKLLGGING